jgi:hypothetical protein
MVKITIFSKRWSQDPIKWQNAKIPPSSWCSCVYSLWTNPDLVIQNSLWTNPDLVIQSFVGLPVLALTAIARQTTTIDAVEATDIANVLMFHYLVHRRRLRLLGDEINRSTRADHLSRTLRFTWSARFTPLIRSAPLAGQNWTKMGHLNVFRADWQNDAQLFRVSLKFEQCRPLWSSSWLAGCEGSPRWRRERMRCRNITLKVSRAVVRVRVTSILSFFLCFFFLELNRENRALLDRLVSAWAASRDDDATRTGAMGRALRRLVVAVLSRPGRTRGALALG